MREQSKGDKKDDFRPSSNTSSMAKIPKIPKLEETKKDESKPSKKPGPSFEDLMFMMDSVNAKAPIKAAPIKNKSRDLIASLTEDASPRPKSPPKIEKQEIKKPALPPVNPVNHVNQVTDD